MTHLRSLRLSAIVLVIGGSCVLPSGRAFATLRAVPGVSGNYGQNEPSGETADNQSNAKADRQITAKIRRSILANKNLSTSAHNVKIITVHGAVTLRGPVKSEDEKQQVATAASSVVPSSSITNELTVKQ